MEGRIFYFGCSECVEYFDSPDQLRSHEQTHVKDSPSPIIHEDLLDTKCFDDNYENLIEDKNDEVLVESKTKLSNLIATHSKLEIDSEFEDIEKDPLVNCTEDEDMVNVKPAINGEKENTLLPNDTKVDEKKVVVQKDGFYICQLCNFKFRKFLEFKYHFRVHAWKLKRNFVSTYCENDDGKLVRVEVKRPKMMHKPNTSGQSFKCTQCPQSFPRLCSLERHAAVVHKVSPHCRRTPRDIRPIQIDDFGAEHQCSFCPASYTNKVDARFHEKTYHSGKTPFICEFCSCSFSLVKGLKWHLSKFHKEIAIEIRRMSLEKSEEKGNKHPLEVSSSHISNSPSAMNQMNTQSPNRKKSSENSATKINTTTPNQKKSCEDSATDHLNTSEHKVTPGGVIMIYADDMYCSYCPLSFSTKLGKKDHERIHTGETPYSCEYCPVTFRLRYTFLAHMKNSHPGKSYSTRYAYKCEICDATFNFKSMLENHQQNAHQKDGPENMKVSSNDEISVSCGICGSSFKGERGLAIHSSMVHRSEST